MPHDLGWQVEPLQVLGSNGRIEILEVEDDPVSVVVEDRIADLSTGQVAASALGVEVILVDDALCMKDVGDQYMRRANLPAEFKRNAWRLAALGNENQPGGSG